MVKKINQKIEHIKISQLKLDHERNPRLPAQLVNASEAEILDYMVTKGSVIDLMLSIGEKGYFEGEPLLGVQEGNDGKITVVEGNRRLSAVMLLNNPKLSTKKQTSLIKIASESDNIPDELPIIVFPKREEILDYLGYRHITGIKPWDTLAKAKYLNQLWEASANIVDHRERSIKLAKIIGSKADYVRKLMCALAIYKKIEEKDFFGIDGADESVSDSFSYITTALNYNHIQNFLGLKSGEEIDVGHINLTSLRKLTGWMFDKSSGSTVIGESRNLKQLAMVVATPKALVELEKGVDLESAYHISGGAEETVSQSIEIAFKQLGLATRYASLIKAHSNMDIDRLNDIILLAKGIKKQLSTDND